MSTPRVLIVMSDYGHDPTETAVPWAAVKEAGFAVHFATEDGKTPQCDKKMLEGLTQKLIGATKSVVDLYAKMASSNEFKQPLPWSAPGFSFDEFDLLLFPGGHDKGVRQVIESPIVHQLLVSYFPKTKKPGKKAVAAVCHGTMALAASKDADGKSVLYECSTTALPARFEQVAYHGTRLVLGDYYKTFGAGSENVEDSVKKVLRDPKTQWKSSLGLGPFVVEDENYNYISARFPGDAVKFGEAMVKLVQSLQ